MPPQANVEYWFRLLYECIRGSCYTNGAVTTTELSSFLSHIWLLVVFVGYIIAILAMIVIIYCIIRLFELRKREEEHYEKLLIAPDGERGINPRWHRIEQLRDSDQPNDWRTAIMEADIMLDDMLSKQGYEGAGVGEKLRAVEPADFGTLDDAWEAHKVRNQIAHEGTDFALTDTLARRTLARYEAVFKEFKIL